MSKYMCDNCYETKSFGKTSNKLYLPYAGGMDGWDKFMCNSKCLNYYIEANPDYNWTRNKWVIVPYITIHKIEGALKHWTKEEIGEALIRYIEVTQERQQYKIDYGKEPYYVDSRCKVKGQYKLY